MRSCQCFYCIYNDESRCMVVRIRVDSRGMCRSREEVHITPQVVKLYKLNHVEKRLLKWLEQGKPGPCPLDGE